MRLLLTLISAAALALGGCHSTKPTVRTPESTGAAKTAPQKPASDSAGAANIEALREKAAEGDAVAQTQLGVQYVKGEALEKDITAAIGWWQKAAESGYAEAQYKLGICYHFGFGVKKSRKLAKHWYEKAASQHHRSAVAALKTLCDDGDDDTK